MPFFAKQFLSRLSYPMEKYGPQILLFLNTCDNVAKESAVSFKLTRGNDVDVHGADVVQSLAVEAHQFGRTVDDGGEGIQDSFVGQGLDNYFVSDAVAVTLGDAYNEFW